MLDWLSGTTPGGEHRRAGRRVVEEQRHDARECGVDHDRVGREVGDRLLDGTELVGHRRDEDRLDVVLQLGDAAVLVAVGQVVLDHTVVEVGDAAERAMAGAGGDDGIAEPRAGEHDDVVAADDEVARDGDDGRDVTLDGARAEEVRGHVCRGLPGGFRPLRDAAGPCRPKPYTRSEATERENPSTSEFDRFRCWPRPVSGLAPTRSRLASS